MKKRILNSILPLIALILMFLILIPYFTLNFREIRQKKEDEANAQKFLKEQLAKKEAEAEAEEKIYLTGMFDPAQRDDFVPIPPQYAISGSKMYLRKETYDAFLKMQSAADNDGVNLKIASATRNFYYQKDLWNKKWNGITLVEGMDLSKSIPDGLERFKKILEYSAAPATSRHHWGTDIDINGAIPEYFESEQGQAVYDWLVKNAGIYGFCQTYLEKGVGRQAGYNEEKWHWSYMPLAKVFTQEYEDLIEDDDIKGFDGDEYVPEQDLINNYVLSINPECI